ncbi:MAG: hypothetical protein ACOCXG_03220, partial [Nanoarchaeota archaeon]
MKAQNFNFNFNNGLLFHNGIQFSLIRVNSFLIILKEIIETEKPEFVKKIFRDSGKVDSYILATKINKAKKSQIEKIRMYLEIMNSVGLGKFELKLITKNSLVIVLDKIFLTNKYYMIYNKKPEVMFAEIVAGFLEYFLKFLLKRETQCTYEKALGKRITFKINLGKKIKIENLEQYQYPKIRKSSNINTLTTRIIINKNLKYDRDHLKLFNFYTIKLPFYWILSLFSFLDIKKYDEFFEILGYSQAKSAIMIQKSVYGFNKINSSELFDLICLQSEIIGLGKIEYDHDKHLIKINNNFKKYLKDGLIGV